MIEDDRWLSLLEDLLSEGERLFGIGAVIVPFDTAIESQDIVTILLYNPIFAVYFEVSVCAEKLQKLIQMDAVVGIGMRLFIASHEIGGCFEFFDDLFEGEGIFIAFDIVVEVVTAKEDSVKIRIVLVNMAYRRFHRFHARFILKIHM